jgi:hypothetical protein
MKFVDRMYLAKNVAHCQGFEKKVMTSDSIKDETLWLAERPLATQVGPSSVESGWVSYLDEVTLTALLERRPELVFFLSNAATDGRTIEALTDNAFLSRVHWFMFHITREIIRVDWSRASCRFNKAREWKNRASSVEMLLFIYCNLQMLACLEMAVCWDVATYNLADFDISEEACR